MIRKSLPQKRLILWLVSCLAILVLVPAVILIHPGMPAHASGGGGGGSPSASIYPTQAAPGTVININGFNYQPNVKVNIYFQTKANGVVTVVTDAGGFFYTALKLPDTYTPGTRYYVHINSTAFSESILFTFTKPSVNVYGIYNNIPSYGAQASVNGNGFTANETVDLTWNFGTTTQKAGVAVAGFDGSFYLNVNMPSIPFGTQTHMVASGRISGLTATVLVNESPAVYDTPTQGVIGTTVKLQGGGFGSNEHVRVLFQNHLVATPTTGPKGSFSATFVVPTGSLIGYENNGGIIATGQVSGVGAQAFFEVLPNVSISPNTGVSGTYITVHGSNFTPNGFVQILWVFPNNTGGSGGSGGGTVFLGSSPVNSHGTFTTPVRAPRGLVNGHKYYVQVIDDPTGASNQATFRAI